MSLPTDSQWERFSALCAYVRQFPSQDRHAIMTKLKAEGTEDVQVLSMVALHLALPPEPDRLRIGERIGDFTLESVLGSGGMGVVYQARQHLMAETTREVAVKLINPSLLFTAQEDAITRFAAEIGMLVKLEYEGIARIYAGQLYDDPKTQERIPYMAMELIRAGQAITNYADEHAVGLSDRIDLFLYVCRAVRYAHTHRIVHRDLKPANILVDADGRPCIIDFGLARACDAILPSRAFAMASGTPAYMSPEQISGAFGPISDKSDTYALGIILYELLTGQRPYAFPGNASIEQLQEVVATAAPMPLGHVHQACQGELEAIVNQSLAKHPDDRMTVAVLQSRLERYLRRAVAPRPVEHQVLEAVSPWVRTFKKRYVLAGIGAVLLLSAVVVAVAVSRPPAALPLPAVAYDTLHRGELTKAARLFKRFVDTGMPREQAQGYAGMAAVNLRQGNTQEVLAFAAQAALRDPDNVYSDVIRGHVFWRQGQLEAAKQAYQNAIDKAHGQPWQYALAAYGLGRIYAEQGFAGTALRYYDQAIGQRADMGIAYASKAQLLVQLGRHEEAQALHRQAVQMEPGQPWVPDLMHRTAIQPLGANPTMSPDVQLDPSRQVGKRQPQ